MLSLARRLPLSCSSALSPFSLNVSFSIIPVANTTPLRTRTLPLWVRALTPSSVAGDFSLSLFLLGRSSSSLNLSLSSYCAPVLIVSIPHVFKTFTYLSVSFVPLFLLSPRPSFRLNYVCTWNISDMHFCYSCGQFMAPYTLLFSVIGVGQPCQVHVSFAKILGSICIN